MVHEKVECDAPYPSRTDFVIKDGGKSADITFLAQCESVHMRGFSLRFTYNVYVKDPDGTVREFDRRQVTVIGGINEKQKIVRETYTLDSDDLVIDDIRVDRRTNVNCYEDKPHGD